MKSIVSVSLGSDKRDHTVETEILGQKFVIQRLGTNGDRQKAIELIKELDGKVDAFGLGGTDLYLWANNKRYILRSSIELVQAAVKSPIVDGSGLKNTLERQAVGYLQQELNFNFKDKKILVVSAMDRFGLAEALDATGAQMTFGDLIFALGIPIPVHSLRMIARLATVAMPIVSRMPFEALYPTGESQEEITPKYEKFYQQADVIAGDFHYIRKNMPDKLNGKMIITNTVTSEDVKLLEKRGVKTLVTTTPELNGRSFGTNVMEAVLVSILEKHWEEIKPDDYHKLLEQIGFVPRVLEFSSESAKENF